LERKGIRSSADPVDAHTQIDLIGAARLMITAEPSAAQIGGLALALVFTAGD